MKKILCFAGLSLVGVMAFAQPKWMNPNVNQENRAPSRATFFAYETTDLALQAADRKSVV